jgi:hypothetical protein
MKLNDANVLEPLHLETADLSSVRRFVNDVPDDLGQEDISSLTRSVLEIRGVVPRPAVEAEQAAAENPGPSATYTGFNRRSTEPAIKPSVVWVPVVPVSRENFEILQKFDGTVLSVTKDSFVARLVDRTNAAPEEEAEIPFAEIMAGDRELVKPGAVLYWVIGYRREAHGQLSRSSVIRFQRLPAWSPADVERAKQAAEKLLSFLDLERADNSA